MSAVKRAAIVTGAGSGLGSAFATGLAESGISVLANNRHRGGGEPSAEALARRLCDTGVQVVADTHAVDAPGAPQAIVDAALAAFGRLDVLVLNAGINGAAGRICEEPPTDLEQVLAINLLANVALLSTALPHLEQSPAGRIVVISSTAGLHGLRGRAAYAASKGALNAYALSLADEQRRTGVGVNIVLPYAGTRMTGDIAGSALAGFSPDKVWPLLAWLTSEACTDTGEMWVAGGGRYRRAYAVETSTTDALDGDGRIRTADMAGAQTYSGGEAAFADFLKEVRHGL